MGRLEAKVAVVTGAGSGIGEATARLMAQEGAAVVAADIRGREAERVADEIEAKGQRAVAVESDVSQEDDVSRMIQTAIDAFGGLDILHNNAADSMVIEMDDDIAALDMEIFDRMVAVNLKGAFMGCKHAIPHMLSRGGGAIVHTASIEGFVGRGVRPAYGACKAGLMHLAKSVAARYGPRGIRCNAVAPGLVLTPSLEPLYQTPEQIEPALKDYAMPRLCTPEDVAKAVVFLASDEASYVNGATLMVDGGMTVYMPVE
jgi:NAD(P)-dependent dehydrogenase (short-subunit alcohol dehydrogenase family)